MRKKDLILIYLYNLSSRYDREFEQLLLNLRSRDSDEVDYLELITVKIKKDTSNDILLEIVKILNY